MEDPYKRDEDPPFVKDYWVIGKAPTYPLFVQKQWRYLGAEDKAFYQYWIENTPEQNPNFVSRYYPIDKSTPHGEYAKGIDQRKETGAQEFRYAAYRDFMIMKIGNLTRMFQTYQFMLDGAANQNHRNAAEQHLTGHIGVVYVEDARRAILTAKRLMQKDWKTYFSEFLYQFNEKDDEKIRRLTLLYFGIKHLHIYFTRVVSDKSKLPEGYINPFSSLMRLNSEVPITQITGGVVVIEKLYGIMDNLVKRREFLLDEFGAYDDEDNFGTPAAKKKFEKELVKKHYTTPVLRKRKLEEEEESIFGCIIN